MAMSDPSLVSVDIPGEAPPNNTMQVNATVRQGGPDPWGSAGNCTSKNLDISAWQTPIRVRVDGEVVDERELCLASGNERSASFSVSIGSTGQHRITVEVLAVGGSAWNLKPRKEEVNDEISDQISVAQDATDPSKSGPLESLKRMLGSVADELGATTTTLGLGMALMVGLLVVV